MAEVQRAIKCKELVGTVIGMDLVSNYLVIAKSAFYTMYNKNVDIQIDGKILLYELPDGTLLSALTPNLKPTHSDNELSIYEYEKALEDITSDKISNESMALAHYTSSLVILLFIMVLTNRIISNEIKIINIFSLLFLMLISVCIIWLITSFTYEYFMHSFYALLDMQEYFKKTGELKQEEIDMIYINSLRKHTRF